MDKTSLDEANLRFSLERKQIKSDYEAQERVLRAELNAKLQNLQYERDKKLLDVARRQDEFRINYLQWKKEFYEKQNENTQQ
jgi:hypothetical protein